MCLYKHYKKKEESMVNNNKLKVVELYKDTITLYKEYISSSVNEKFTELQEHLKTVENVKNTLISEKDEEALTILHMWYIDGEGWLNLVPVDEQIEQALRSCEKALGIPNENIDEFMNLDIQYINPNMTQIDEENVDELVGALKQAKDNIVEEINKIEKDDTMSNNEENKTNKEGKTMNESKKSNWKKYAKYALGGAVVLGAAVGLKYAYDNFVEDGVIVVDFGK